MIEKEEKYLFILGEVLTVVLAIVCGCLSITAGIICFLLGSVLLAAAFLILRRRRRKLEALNEYLRLVCSGQYDMQPEENREGELSILANNLYKVILQLQTQKELLEKDKIFLAETMADITHQLKTPLTSLTVLADVLKEEVQEHRQQEFLSTMQAQLSKMNWLVLNLLKLSKLDAGTVVLKQDKISSGQLIAQSTTSFLLTMEQKNITLLDRTEDFNFVGDLAWSVEAVSNIIKNCIEHMREGDCLTFESEHSTLYDSLIITDTGCGINEKDLPHIFERFYRGEHASPDSAGIGLALAKTILEKEHAQISVESEVGKGSVFLIRFYHALV